MKYKSCRYIQTGIAFRHDAISMCNKLSGTKRYEEFNLPYTVGFFENFLELHNEMIENAKKGQLPHEGCLTCPFVEEKNWDEDTRFKEFEITHWVHCNCACCYCSMKPNTKGKITRFAQNAVDIQVLPYIKRMLKENMIHPNAFFSITGGELTMLKEFRPMLKLLLKQKDASYGFCLQTNGIKYEPLLVKAVNKDRRTSIVISVDAGSRELFKKMKRKDAYNDVWKNIKKYIKHVDENRKYKIVVKYIIVPNVNDSKQEIDKWIETCKKNGVKTLQPAIEFCSQIVNPGTFKENQGILYNYMKEKILENGFEMVTYDFLEKIIENKSFDITIQ